MFPVYQWSFSTNLQACSTLNLTFVIKLLKDLKVNVYNRTIMSFTGHNVVGIFRYLANLQHVRITLKSTKITEPYFT